MKFIVATASAVPDGVKHLDKETFKREVLSECLMGMGKIQSLFRSTGGPPVTALLASDQNGNILIINNLRSSSPTGLQQNLWGGYCPVSGI